MFIATTKKKLQCNEDKQYMLKHCFITITHINKTTSVIAIQSLI